MASPLHCEYILAIPKNYSAIVHHLEYAVELNGSRLSPTRTRCDDGASDHQGAQYMPITVQQTIS
jgi:hypothetical protein